MTATALSAAMSAALPQDAGRPRVQRLVEEFPQIHIEAQIPVRDAWSVTVEGLVERPLELSLAHVAGIAHAHSAIDLHCVWGWSRAACRWEGVPGAAFIERCRPLPQASHVVLHAADSPYASCIPLADAARGMFALKLDGERLAPEHGGPLRYVGPAELWAYKGVKWLRRVVFFDHLEPGFWESKVGDVEGRVPEAVLDLFDHDRAGSSP
jgi:DMSO/TMAO reductase YedYZ molybdopterin-dependent catalytic subunit